MYKIELDMIRFLFNSSKTWMDKREIIEHVAFFNKEEKEEKIEKMFTELLEKGVITDCIDCTENDINLWKHVEKYSLSTYGVRYAMEERIISVGNLFDKISDVQMRTNDIYHKYKHITNYVDDIRKDTISINHKIKATEKNIKETEKKIKKAEKESQSLKNDIISILGIFISIFTLISVNVGLLSAIEKVRCKISFVLIVNGTLLTSILLMIVVIKVVILEKSLKNHLRIILAVFIISSLLIVIGLYNVKFMF